MTPVRVAAILLLVTAGCIPVASPVYSQLRTPGATLSATHALNSRWSSTQPATALEYVSRASPGKPRLVARLNASHLRRSWSFDEESPPETLPYLDPRLGARFELDNAHQSLRFELGGWLSGNPFPDVLIYAASGNASLLAEQRLVRWLSVFAGAEVSAGASLSTGGGAGERAEVVTRRWNASWSVGLSAQWGWASASVFGGRWTSDGEDRWKVTANLAGEEQVSGGRAPLTAADAFLGASITFALEGR